MGAGKTTKVKRLETEIKHIISTNHLILALYLVNFVLLSFLLHKVKTSNESVKFSLANLRKLADGEYLVKLDNRKKERWPLTSLKEVFHISFTF